MRTTSSSPSPLVVIVAVVSILVLLLSCSFIYLLGETQGNWEDWKQATCLPNSCFCEEPRNGTLLRQPVNTWSNMTFTVAGCAIVILVAHKLEYVDGNKKNKKRANQELRAPQPHHVDYNQYWFFALTYALGLIFLGCTSGFYHASLTFVGQVLDNTGMYFIVCWGIAYNAHRFNPREISRLVFLVLYGVQIIVFTLVNIYLPDIRRYAFFGSVLFFVLSQLVTDVFVKPEIYYRYFFAALGSIVVGFSFWIIDNKKIVCEPISWFQGHGIWHALDALCAFFLYLFFASEGYKPSEYEPVKMSDLEAVQHEENEEVAEEEEEMMEQEQKVMEQERNAVEQEQEPKSLPIHQVPAQQMAFAPPQYLMMATAPHVSNVVFGGHHPPPFYNNADRFAPPHFTVAAHYLQQEPLHNVVPSAPLYPNVQQ